MSGVNNIKGLMGKGVPPTPSFFAVARVAALVLSLAVLAACAYCLSLLGTYSSYNGPPGFMLFVAIFTIVVLGGAMAVERFAPHLYFRVAVLIGYGINCLLWLSGWAWSTSIATLFLGNTCIGRTCFGPTSEEMRYGGSMAGAAAIGAINWLLMGIVMFYFVKGCLADPDCYGVATGHESEMGSAKGERESRS
ncbi:hypothetical protein LX36DRAFT_680678 [Colletotrichum falcatum]|nr:hypothetical protein LX36DRAFT_680678 [Colletotrichum falcatum]